MADVTHFMRDHAGKFIGALGFLQQSVEEIDFPTRQSEGVGDARGDDFGLPRHFQMASLAQCLDELCECPLPLRT